MSLHIGKIIEEVFKDSAITPEQFAKKLGYNGRDSTYKIFQRDTIDTGLLVEISKLLKHDFFQYYTTQTELNKAVPATKDDVALILKAINKLAKKPTKK